MILGMLLLSSSMLPIHLAIAHILAPQPQGIFLLGGGHEREVATARFAKAHPELEVWISSGSNPERVEAIFTRFGIPMERVHLDYRAQDTVTNFTSMVSVFHKQDLHHLFLLTSDFHMARSRTLATLIFGFHSIVVTPIPIADQRESEPWFKLVRDSIRAIVWIITGYSGADFAILIPVS
jgi:uncharacterized SAM-binding protein YcdF (DUF218 family)